MELRIVWEDDCEPDYKPILAAIVDTVYRASLIDDVEVGHAIANDIHYIRVSRKPEYKVLDLSKIPSNIREEFLQLIREMS